MNLELNNGPGYFVSGIEEESLCACIKRQSGELNGTTDLVLLPSLTIKNCLPCSLEIKRMKQIPEDASLRRMENEEEDTQIYFVDKSEEKQFHTFKSNTDRPHEVQFQFRVDGFLWSDQIQLEYYRVEELDVEILDHC